MPEFWVSSGHHLTPRTEGGGLAITDELILAYLARPELVPPDEACAAERRLHASLMASPRRAVVTEEIAAVVDPDARENWSGMLEFRERLLAAPSVEAAYLDIARRPAATPPLFLNQLVHLILRNALDRCEDPYVLRAAELFFRPQRVSFLDGAAVLADAEVIETHEEARGPSPLAAMLGQEPAAELDVLDDGNLWTYWSRSDAFTMALALGANPRSREGLARAIEAWVAHLLNIEVAVEPVARIEDPDWRWFVGLDAEATRIGNALWTGEEIEADAPSRMLALFRLTFPNARAVEQRMAGFPVYLLLAMSEDRHVRMKPQNLIVGLPVAADARAA
jgi:hypothetical protein